MPKQPNILILMPDQQRADCVSCAGHPQVRTPHMDRIAAEGVRFARACTSSPLCMPARASFLCGRHVHSHGMWGNGGELAPGDVSLFGSLRDCGYRTAHVGKSHYYSHGPFHMREREPYMHARGFDHVDEVTGPWATRRCESYMTDEWERKGLLQAFRDDYDWRWRHRDEFPVRPSSLPVNDFLDSYVGRQAARFIDGHDGARPFALFVGFGGPHEPWDAPGEYATMYDPAETPPAVPSAEPGDWVPQAAAEWQRSGRYPDMTPGHVAAMRANYYGKISLVDHWVGEILAACERRGVLDDTLIVFWSDHGELAGDHGLLYKSRFFEGALRVPLMVRWPGRVPVGVTTDALACTIDIMPTVLEAAGAPVPESCEGVSLWPALHDPAARPRQAVLSEVEKAGRRNTMVCTERHKLAVHEDGTPYMLYDLARDPDEQRNLIGMPDAAEVEREMLGLLAKLRSSDQ